MSTEDNLVQRVKKNAFYLPDTGFQDAFIRGIWRKYNSEFEGRHVIDIGAGKKLDFLPHALYAGAKNYSAVEPCEDHYNYAKNILDGWIKTEQVDEMWAKLVYADALEYLVKQTSNNHLVVSFGVFGEFQSEVSEEVEHQYMQEYAKEVHRITLPGALTVQWPLARGYGKYFEGAGFKQEDVDNVSLVCFDHPLWRKEG